MEVSITLFYLLIDLPLQTARHSKCKLCLLWTVDNILRMITYLRPL